MDRASALNLYRINTLERCEIYKCEGDSFKIKIYITCLNELSFFSEDEVFLTEIFEDSPMVIDDEEYAVKVVKRIGFKDYEIKVVK